MWNTLGSLREQAGRRLVSARENAAAAVQVATDVLQAAAVEDDQTQNVSPTLSARSGQSGVSATSAQVDGDGWGQWPADAAPAPPLGADASQPPPPPPESAPDGFSHPPPPPPPQGVTDTFSRPPAPAAVPRARKSRRPTARYVVTGTATTNAQTSAYLAPPMPTFAGTGSPKSTASGGSGRLTPDSPPGGQAIMSNGVVSPPGGAGSPPTGGNGSPTRPAPPQQAEASDWMGAPVPAQVEQPVIAAEGDGWMGVQQPQAEQLLAEGADDWMSDRWESEQPSIPAAPYQPEQPPTADADDWMGGPRRESEQPSSPRAPLPHEQPPAADADDWMGGPRRESEQPSPPSAPAPPEQPPAAEADSWMQPDQPPAADADDWMSDRRESEQPSLPPPPVPSEQPPAASGDDWMSAQPEQPPVLDADDWMGGPRRESEEPSPPSEQPSAAGADDWMNGSRRESEQPSAPVQMEQSPAADADDWMGGDRRESEQPSPPSANVPPEHPPAADVDGWMQPEQPPAVNVDDWMSGPRRDSEHPNQLAAPYQPEQSPSPNADIWTGGARRESEQPNLPSVPVQSDQPPTADADDWMNGPRRDSEHPNQLSAPYEPEQTPAADADNWMGGCRRDSERPSMPSAPVESDQAPESGFPAVLDPAEQPTSPDLDGWMGGGRRESEQVGQRAETSQPAQKHSAGTFDGWGGVQESQPEHSAESAFPVQEQPPAGEFDSWTSSQPEAADNESAFSVSTTDSATGNDTGASFFDMLARPVAAITNSIGSPQKPDGFGSGARNAHAMPPDTPVPSGRANGSSAADGAQHEATGLTGKLGRLLSSKSPKPEASGKQDVKVQEDFQVIMLERDTAIASKELVSRELDALKRELLELRDEVADAKDDAHRAVAQRDDALQRVSSLEAERQNAFSGSGDVLAEQRKLVSDTERRAADLAQKELELRSMETALRQSSGERDTEAIQVEALSAQLVEMKDAFDEAILERNHLHGERNLLNEELRKAMSDLNGVAAKVADVERKSKFIAQQKQEIEARGKLLQTEANELRGQVEAISNERNSLVQERATAFASSSDHPEAIKALSRECEEKTREISSLQQKVQAAAAKVAKVTSQRNTVLRQRDDAASRLNAAGAEFTTLRTKMTRLSTSNNDALKSVQQLQDERDGLRQQIGAMAANAVQGEGLRKALVESRARCDAMAAELAQLHQNIARSEEVQRTSGSDLQLTKAELKRLEEAHGALTRDLAASRSETKTVHERERTVRRALKASKQECFDVNAALAQAQTQLRASVERAETEQKRLLSQLEAEQSASKSYAAELESARSMLQDHGGDVQSLRAELQTGIQEGFSVLNGVDTTLLEGLNYGTVHDPETVKDLGNMSGIEVSQTFRLMHLQACENLKNVIDSLSSLHDDAQKLRTSHMELSEKNAVLENQMEDVNVRLTESTEECSRLRDSEIAAQRALQEEKNSSSNLTAEKQTLLEDVESSHAKIDELRSEVDEVSTALAQERSTRDSTPSDEKQKLLDTLSAASEVAQSMWSLVENNVSAEIVRNIAENREEAGDESVTSVGPMALQGFRVMVVEMNRLREGNSEFEEKLSAAQREIESIWEKTELAETERDSARAARDRLEREAKSAHGKGYEEAAQQLQDKFADLEQELLVSRQDMSILQDSLEKSEREAEGLKSLCSKRTTQFNSRTQELDEAEEKLAYLQDHVATLEEDLEMAQQRAHSGEKQSGEAHRVEMEQLSAELSASLEHASGLEEECIKLREETDKAKNELREASLIAETHKTAEQNLQIAIEQLEAEQDSMISRKTLELQRKLEDALTSAAEADKKMSEASGVQNKLTLRDEEITELRTALGRLADERVELKLELEKSLSRLNHPEGGQQLVDRRVVRQLLVNYFRVGTARRRDILELMSRMLGFTDSDQVTVGLKRVAIMDRIGSLVQPPDLDGNSLPPIGTVSDKWIEFLMKETEEEEEDF